MINYLKDIKKETLIGQLPDVINNNNDSIRKEFNWMFDSSLNRLTKSVYAPTGSVKAHFGEFVNLSCEYLTIKNEESIKNSIQSTVELVIADSFDPSTKQLTNHNILNHRFIDSQYEGATDYTHDAASIVYEKEDGKYVTVKDVLDRIIDAPLPGIYKMSKQNDVTIDSLNNQVTSITNDVINLNTNNILNQQSDDIVLNKNQNNILFNPIYNDNTIINIKFDNDEYDHEYNFKFILNENINRVHLIIDGWYNNSNGDKLFVNNDNIKITYSNKDNMFVLTRGDDIKNIIMCDITINKYGNKSNNVCTMSCKIYNYLKPE